MNRYPVAIVNQWSEVTLHTIGEFASTDHKITISVIQLNRVFQTVR